MTTTTVRVPDSKPPTPRELLEDAANAGDPTTEAIYRVGAAVLNTLYDIHTELSDDD